MAGSSLVTRAATVKSRSIRWAWTGRLALGYLTVTTGVEGLGKSVFAAWLVARLTRGELPGEWDGEPVAVLIVAGEDGIEDTWRPRLELAGADLELVAFLNLDQLASDWNLRDGIEQVSAAIEETGARFVYVDAVLDHVPVPRSGESINSPTFVRQALGPFKRLVREREIVGQFTMHPPKARSGDFRDLVQASQAFSAIPRVGLLLAYHPEDNAEDPGRRRVIIRGKGNLGRDPGALEFRVVGKPFMHDDGRMAEREVVVDVVSSPVTLADLAPDRMIGAREPTKAERAADVMRDALADGEWHLAAPIREQLARQDLDSGSVRTRAKGLAKVAERKRPGEKDGPHEWRIPESDSEESNGNGPFPVARATCPSDVDPSIQNTVNPSSNGKGPRVHDPRPTDTQASKSPSAGDYARASETASAGATTPLAAAVDADGAASAEGDSNSPRSREPTLALDADAELARLAAKGLAE
jgi:hypothetical protein